MNLVGGEDQHGGYPKGGPGEHGDHSGGYPRGDNSYHYDSPSGQHQKNSHHHEPNGLYSPPSNGYH